MLTSKCTKSIIKKITLITALLSSSLIGGCGSVETKKVVIEEQAPPLVFAQAGGKGHWPPNSVQAVRNSIKNKHQGVELDIVLTRDNIPVLSHTPWLDQMHCRKKRDGAALKNKMLIRQFTYEQLSSLYICEGGASSKTPALSSLQQVLEELKPHPELAVYLDIKMERSSASPPQTYANAVLGLWKHYSLSNKLYVEVPSTSSLKIFREFGDELFTGILPFPKFTSTNEEGVFLPPKIASDKELPVKQAQSAGTDAIASPMHVLPLEILAKLKQGGIQTILYTPNSREELQKLCDWPVDILITDYPELGTCTQLN